MIKKDLVLLEKEQTGDYNYKYLILQDSGMFNFTAFYDKEGLKNFLKKCNLKIGELIRETKGHCKTYKLIGDIEENYHYNKKDIPSSTKTISYLSNGDFRYTYKINKKEGGCILYITDKKLPYKHR